MSMHPRFEPVIIGAIVVNVIVMMTHFDVYVS